MVLSAQSIRKNCLVFNMIVPFVERAVSSGGKTYGLGPCSYDVRVDQNIYLPSHGCALASTIERFRLPNNVAMEVKDKSTWVRLFVAVQNTHGDPGWEGWLTLELTNHSQSCITINQGEPIAQVMFHLLDEPTEMPYRGKYQHQERRPVPARFDKTD